MHVFDYKTSSYFNMENKVVDKIVERKINWNEYTVDENGFLIRKDDGTVEGQYLYEDEEVCYSSIASAIRATLRFAF